MDAAVMANQVRPYPLRIPFLALMIPLFASALGVKDQPGTLPRHEQTAI